jgi:hypothetical protein
MSFTHKPIYSFVFMKLSFSFQIIHVKAITENDCKLHMARQS